MNGDTPITPHFKDPFARPEWMKPEEWEAILKECRPVTFNVEPLFTRLTMQHQWHVELVVRSKMMEALGYEPTDDEIKEEVRLVNNPGSEWYHILWGGHNLISWSHPQAIKFNDNQPHELMFVKYIR